VPLPLIPLTLRSGPGGVISPGSQALCQIFRPGGVSGPSTAFAAAVSAGGGVGTPLSMFGIRAGMQLVLGWGTANQETVTVGSVTATQFSLAAGHSFAHSHAKGDLIDGAVAGTQNFLVDVTDIATQFTWNDLQQGGMEQATVQLLNPYVNITDIVGGNWLLMSPM